MSLQANDLHGKRTLIIGEAGVGKTQLTAQLFRTFVAKYPEEPGVVIDMAPPVITMEDRRLGGYISDLEPLPANVRLLIPSSIAPPRLQGTSALEVQALAESNKAAIEPLLDHYLKNPTPLLVINDLTIYLHAGSVQRLVKIIQPAKTFIGNAYHGEFLRDDRGSHISAREREAVDELLPLMDYVIRLPGMQR